MALKKGDLMNIPNWLSLGRIAAVPIVVLLLQFSRENQTISMIAGAIYLIAVLTDLVDGYLARRYQLETDLGRFLDPLADKLINMAAMIMLIPLGRIPAWVVFLILGREIAVTGLRAIASTEGVVISADRMGKQKTVLQDTAIFCLIWNYSIFGLNAQAIGQVMIYIALLVTIWSGYTYFRAFFLGLKGRQNEAK